VKERYLVIGKDYGAPERQDAEYKYRGVFVAAVIMRQRRSDLNNIYTLTNIYRSIYYTSIFSFVSLNVFSELPTIGPTIFAFSENITNPITVYCYSLRYQDIRAISITNRNRNSIKLICIHRRISTTFLLQKVSRSNPEGAGPDPRDTDELLQSQGPTLTSQDTRSARSTDTTLSQGLPPGLFHRAAMRGSQSQQFKTPADPLLSPEMSRQPDSINRSVHLYEDKLAQVLT